MEDPGQSPATLSEVSDPNHINHLTRGFFPRPTTLLPDGKSLPYYSLGDKGFERLCYSLLLEEGQVPRFFGNPGQEQYGIDLLVDSNKKRAVYQCKNYEKDFSAAKMKKAVLKFEQEWLEQRNLPRPEEFYLCCSLPLQDKTENEEWTKFKDEFHTRTGVSVEVWDRIIIDEKLRRLPDVVADLFSDRAAEEFCSLYQYQWNADRFRPVTPNCGNKDIKRYLSRRDSGRLYLSETLVDKFVAGIETNGSLLIQGLPGAGKTITALALAEAADQRRVFYIDLRYDFSEDDLVKGFRYRLTYPTIFLLDNCQGKFDFLYSVREIFGSILRERPGKGLLLFVTRTTPTPEGMARGDDEEFTEFQEDMQQAESLIELSPTLNDFCEIVTLVRPDLEELSEARLKKLFAFTGRDLFLLDQLLDTLTSVEEIDQLSPEKVFERVLTRYFGKRTVSRPCFSRLTALAQFDLTPPVASFGCNLAKEDREAANELLIEAGHPTSYFFLHSSAGELIFRSLIWCAEENHVNESVAVLVDFFRERKPHDKRLASDLANVLYNHLKLSDEEENLQLKQSFLTRDEIYELIETCFARLPLKLMAACLRWLKSSDASTQVRYVELMRRKLEDGTVLDLLISPEFPPDRGFMNLLKRDYPESFAILQGQIGTRGMREIVGKTKLQNLLSVLTNISDPQSNWLLSSLSDVPDEEFVGLVTRTISSGHSIGTLNLALRELQKTDEVLLRKLEEKIGAQRYLSLIAGVGTILEMFRIIQYSTPKMAEELIAALDEPLLDKLVAKTITSQRSIGTLNLALWELRKSDKTLPLLQKLEEKVGAQRYLSLIAGAGTISELFKIIEHSTPKMAEELIAALDEPLLDKLVAKTITSQRSIGTLHLALWELRKTDEVLLRKLEEKVGAQRYLSLIAGAGTIFELFRIIQYSTPKMAEELIAALDEPLLDKLVAKTITSQRSIGTLDFTLRELRKSDKTLPLLQKLEEKVGAQRYLSLIASAGTISELFLIIRYSTPKMAEELIAALDEPLLDKLVAKTITSQRSIGTLNLALWELRKTDEVLLRKLEEKIGAQRYLSLIAGVGTILEMFRIIQYSTPKMAEELIAALDEPLLGLLIERTVTEKRSLGSLHWTLSWLKQWLPVSLARLERSIGVSRWWEMICSNATVGVLPLLLSSMSRGFSYELIKAAEKLTLQQWQGLILRGDFSALCYFIKNATPSSIRIFKGAVRKQLPELFEELASRDGWEPLNRGYLLLRDASHSDVKNLLDKSLDKRLKVSPNDFMQFSSFSESASCVQLLVRKFPHRRDHLIRAFMQFWRGFADWSKGETYLRSVRGIFLLLADPQSRPADAKAVLLYGNSPAIADLCYTGTAQDVLLYLWNLFCLWSEWKEAQDESFAGFLDPDISDAVCDLLVDRFKEFRDEMERDNAIALAGLLTFFELDNFKSEEITDLRAELPGFSQLLKRETQKTFVPGFFYFQGLEWFFAENGRVPQDRWKILLPEAGKYIDKTAALNYLVTLVRRRAGYSK